MKEIEGAIGGGRAKVEVEVEGAVAAATLAARRSKKPGGGVGGTAIP